MFNNAEDHLQGKFRLQQLNFAGGGAFFCLLPKFAAVFSGHSCNLYPRFFYIAIWIFCKILIGDTAAADLLAVHHSGRCKKCGGSEKRQFGVGHNEHVARSGPS